MLLGAVVVTVRVAVTLPVPVIATGLVAPKLTVGRYCAPAGLDVTVAESATSPVKPAIGVSVTVDVLPVVAPGVTERAVPLTVKVGVGAVTEM